MSPQTRFLPILPDQHRAHGWRRHGGSAFAARQPLVTVVLNELTALAPVYPLAFARMPGGSHQLVALTGLHSADNLFVAPDGRWLAPYIPGQFRSYPFALAPLAAATPAKLMLCFDHGSGLYRESPDPQQGEERFFNDAGQAGPFMAGLIEFLDATVKASALTQRAVDALADADLLVPWQWAADPQFPDAQPLAGLYRINEPALNALKGPALETLLQTRGLLVAYAQLLSMARLGTLRDMHAARARAQSATPATAPSIDALFGEDKAGGTISFAGLDKL